MHDFGGGERIQPPHRPCSHLNPHLRRLGIAGLITAKSLLMSGVQIHEAIGIFQNQIRNAA
jgi:hypothetical protein